MRKFKDLLILLTIAFSGLFLLNTGLMYLLFGVNVLNPVQREDQAVRRTTASDEAKPAASSGTVAEETGVEGFADPETPGTVPMTDGEFMTLEEVQSLGELGLRDKLAALTVLSKIGSNESDRIYELAIDGVTNAEMEEIKGLLEKKLSEADMEVLYGILDRSRKLYAEKVSEQKEKVQQAINAR